MVLVTRFSVNNGGCEMRNCFIIKYHKASGVCISRSLDQSHTSFEYELNTRAHTLRWNGERKPVCASGGALVRARRGSWRATRSISWTFHRVVLVRPFETPPCRFLEFLTPSLMFAPRSSSRSRVKSQRKSHMPVATATRVRQAWMLTAWRRWIVDAEASAGLLSR